MEILELDLNLNDSGTPYMAKQFNSFEDQWRANPLICSMPWFSGKAFKLPEVPFRI
jgi:hypothetical protein